MGIIRLGEFLKKTYPQTIKRMRSQTFAKKVFAVDASSTIYSFLAKTITYSSNRVNMPTDSSGNMTGHLIGLLYRGLLCKQLGIETVWVFDGRAPRQKSDQLYRRRTLKEQASEKADEAREAGDIEQATKQSKRMIFITESERQDAKKLIEYMGMPVIQAKSQAEAQCAWLAKNKLVEGVIGQDIDTIVFGAQKLIRNFNREDLCSVIELQEVLKALELTNEQFVDFCILCGCDYTSKIAGIGPVKALKLIKENKNIEGVIQKICNNQKLRSKHQIPDDFNYLIARRLFQKPSVIQVNSQQLIQKEVSQDDLRLFLLQKQFSDKRIQNWIQNAKKFDSILK